MPVDISKLDNKSLVSLREQVLVEIKRRVRTIETDLELMQRLVGEAGGGTGTRTRARKRGAKRAAKAGGGRRRRGKRGESWGIIRAALEKAGGSAKTSDLKSAWSTFGSRTPLGVNLAGHVKAKRLKKKGKGRQAVYILAEA